MFFEYCSAYFFQTWVNATELSFKAFFGVSTLLFAEIALCVQECPTKHIMMTLHFLKWYPSSNAIHFIWGVSEKKYREIVWQTIILMNEVLPQIEQNLEAPFGNHIFQNIRYVIDATECRIKRYVNWVLQAFFYSNKKKMHSVKYQIIVDAVLGTIQDVYGPYCGSTHDNKIYSFWKMDTNFEFTQNEKLLGDKGYQGNNDILSPIKQLPNSELSKDEKQFNKIVGSVRCIVEQTFARVKKFHCISNIWRHPLSKHGLVFQLVCKIVNMEIQESKIRNNKSKYFFLE